MPIKFRTSRLVPVIMLAFATILVAIPSIGGTGQAHAQQREPRTLLELLRGDQGSKPQIQEVPRQRSTNRVIRTRRAPSTSSRTIVRRSKPAASTAAAPAPDSGPVEKLENARTILVVGDFIADGMAQGLKDAFADVAGIEVVSRANGSSGFVRDDFYDWPASIGPILEETKPVLVVVMIGSNDRQVMRVDGSTAKVRTDAWNREYVARITRFIEPIRASGARLIWVGGPPFRFKSMSADILAFNEFFRTATEAADGTFVDIWDGFVDADGAFILRGSDINGQDVRLRASDGINFTKEGKRKLAFYAERQIRQMLGDAASPLLTTLAPESFSTMRLPPLQPEAELVRFNPIRVDDPELDGGAALLGDITAPVPDAPNNPLQARSMRNRLVHDGVPPPAQTGRANDFSWPETEEPPEG
jgi:hypothetical protein